MEDTSRYVECEECGAEYNVQTDMDIESEFCPFCGEPMDMLEWKENYENTEQESES